MKNNFVKLSYSNSISEEKVSAQRKYATTVQCTVQKYFFNIWKTQFLCILPRMTRPLFKNITPLMGCVLKLLFAILISLALIFLKNILLTGAMGVAVSLFRKLLQNMCTVEVAS